MLENREAKPLPSTKFLNSIFWLDEGTGWLHWKLRPREHFKSDIAWKSHNRHMAGQRLSMIPRNSEYLKVCLGRRSINQHRIVWKMTHGEDANYIDHINGDKADNRSINLRSVTKSENARNAKRSIRNKSGVTGVQCRNNYRGPNKWQARIRYEGELINLGHYPTMEDAVAARMVAQEKYGFHENHGKDR